MSVTNSNKTNQRVTRAESIDLASFSPLFPEGTMVEITVRGTPHDHTIELERNGLRYMIERSGRSAELTGVFGASDPDKPTRVPDWIERVLGEACGIREVSVYR